MSKSDIIRLPKFVFVTGEIRPCTELEIAYPKYTITAEDSDYQDIIQATGYFAKDARNGFTQFTTARLTLQSSFYIWILIVCSDQFPVYMANSTWIREVD